MLVRVHPHLADIRGGRCRQGGTRSEAEKDQSYLIKPFKRALKSELPSFLLLERGKSCILRAKVRLHNENPSFSIQASQQHPRSPAAEPCGKMS